MPDVRTKLRKKSLKVRSPDSYSELCLTEKIVSSELTEAEIYWMLLFEMINPLGADSEMQRAANEVLTFTQRALDLTYVITLSKIFADANEEGLEKLLHQCRNVFDHQVSLLELKRERLNEVCRPAMDAARNKVLDEYDSYLAKIRQIRDKLEPLRNIARAHNFPRREFRGDGILWQTTREWITFGQQVYNNIMISVGDSGLLVGGFVSSTMQGAITSFVKAATTGARVAFGSLVYGGRVQELRSKK